MLFVGQIASLENIGQEEIKIPVVNAQCQPVTETVCPVLKLMVKIV